ncbi:MAG: FIST C-terminal domain-containing protein [Oligoflexales bacterium]|nr:FIST C-terminal domain-containing protein [Oligoflexales bacterium]
MKIFQSQWKAGSGWKDLSEGNQKVSNPQLVLVFGGRDQLAEAKRFDEIRNIYKKSQIISVSTAGEILKDNVYDDTITATAIELGKTKVKIASLTIKNSEDSESVGKNLGKDLQDKDLCYVLVLSDGLKVNGTSLLQGINSVLDKNLVVTGGLAGDGSRFVKTLVGVDAAPSEHQVVAIGFYGKDLVIGHGSVGGWDPFGPIRKVTRSEGNILYELDGQPALDLYKNYLGEQAKSLPGSGLLFPLSIHLPGNKGNLVRTILAVDEEKKSLTFAGDIPNGGQVQLMKANFERLIDGASLAATQSVLKQEEKAPQLALLISCVGRKLVLGPRIDEEIEGVRSILGASTKITGFYSYGELSPLVGNSSCELHNQTMTITTLSEK